MFIPRVCLAGLAIYMRDGNPENSTFRPDIDTGRGQTASMTTCIMLTIRVGLCCMRYGNLANSILEQDVDYDNLLGIFALICICESRSPSLSVNTCIGRSFRIPRQRLLPSALKEIDRNSRSLSPSISSFELRH